MERGKSGGALAAVISVIAVFFLVGLIGLFWVVWRGVAMLKSGASHAVTVMVGDASALAGRSDYIGTWKGSGQTLTIQSTGQAEWSKVVPGSSEKWNGSVSFDGDFLVVDILVTTKRMHIDAPPHPDGTRTVMTLDGVELEKL